MVCFGLLPSIIEQMVCASDGLASRAHNHDKTMEHCSIAAVCEDYVVHNRTRPAACRPYICGWGRQASTAVQVVSIEFTFIDCLPKAIDLNSSCDSLIPQLPR